MRSLPQMPGDTGFGVRDTTGVLCERQTIGQMTNTQELVVGFRLTRSLSCLQLHGRGLVPTSLLILREGEYNHARSLPLFHDPFLNSSVKAFQ